MVVLFLAFRKTHLSSALFFFSSRRRHTRYWRDWSSDVCSSDLSFLGKYRQRLFTLPARECQFSCDHLRSFFGRDDPGNSSGNSRVGSRIASVECFRPDFRFTCSAASMVSHTLPGGVVCQPAFSQWY